MHYLSLTFCCELNAKASFSAYKGSMIRGTFGTHLKKTCCTTRERDCAQCMLKSVCTYPSLFIGKPARGEGRYDSLTLPFCFETCDTGKTEYEGGERFVFGVKLFSYATAYVPYFAHAFVLAGKHGMGRKSDACPGTFELLDIVCDETSIYDRERQKVSMPAPENLALPALDENAGGMQRVRVHLVTPCRFKEGNKLSADLSFKMLFQLVVRRLRSLWALDGESVHYENFRDMITLAESVRTVESGLFWKDWTRYSSRQNTYMQLGGLQGSIVYEGRIAPFLPFLAMAEKLHIGKQTSFGLGEVHFVLDSGL